MTYKMYTSLRKKNHGLHPQGLYLFVYFLQHNYDQESYTYHCKRKNGHKSYFVRVCSQSINEQKLESSLINMLHFQSIAQHYKQS